MIWRQADPHVQETCEECGHVFWHDLEWEAPSHGSHYVAIDEDGNTLDAEEAGKRHMPLSHEQSAGWIECPKCHAQWPSIYSRDPLSTGNKVKIEPYHGSMGIPSSLSRSVGIDDD